MAIIGRSGGKPGKQGKSKWEDSINESVELNQTIGISETPIVDNSTDSVIDVPQKDVSEVKVKSEKSTSKKTVKKRKPGKDALAILMASKKPTQRGSQISVYLKGEQREFLEKLKVSDGISPNSLFQLLLDDFMEKYYASEDNEEDDTEN